MENFDDKNIENQGLVESIIRFNKNKPSVVIRFIQKLESSYITVCNDAEIVSKILFGSSSCCKICSVDNLNEFYLIINQHRFEKAVRDLLLVKRLIVEIYKDCPKSNIRFQLTGRGSPGNLGYFEDIVYNQQNQINTGVIVVIYITNQENGVKKFSLCFFKSLENHINFIEYQDTDSFTETESIFVQINPVECIIPQIICNEYKTIEDLCENHNILVSKVKANSFKNVDMDYFSDVIDSDFTSIQHKINIELPDVLKCLNVLLLNLADQNSENLIKYTISPYNRSNFMCLDASAISSLSIFPTNDTLKNFSLYNLLNSCKTKEGQRLLQTWIRQPLKDKEQLENRLNLVEFFVDHTKQAKDIQDQLRNIPDTSLMVKKLSGNKASLLDCVKIYFMIKKIPRILEIFSDCSPSARFYESVDTNFVSPLREIICELKKYCNMIESLVDLNINVGEEYKIRDDIDANLGEINQSLSELETKIEQHAENVCDRVGLEMGKTFKKEYSPRRGYYFRVTLKLSKNIDENKFTIIETLKDGIYFVDTKMKEYSDDYCQLKKEYSSFQSQFIKDLINVASDYIKLLKRLGCLLSNIDVILSFSMMPASTTKRFVRPEILESETGVIEIKNGRHPCLEQSLDTQFIPNDLILNKNDNYFAILTGPNMGGKSTYLRQCAIIILMTQIGCFVPCESARISLVHKIITRVGASDYTLKGLSTFMAEMVDACSILRNANENSFVIVDELGRGTSTFDGFGLSWSIAEYISTNIKCYTIFATHFHEITQLASIHPGVKNYRVETLSRNDEFIMCYKVVQGACNQSLGVKVAEMVRFPQEIIQDAKDILSIFEKSPNVCNFQDDQNSYIDISCDKIAQLHLDSINEENLKKELEVIIY